MSHRKILEVFLGAVPVTLVWGSISLFGLYALVPAMLGGHAPLDDPTAGPDTSFGDYALLLFFTLGLAGIGGLWIAVLGHPAENRSKAVNRTIAGALGAGMLTAAIYLALFLYYVMTPAVESVEPLWIQLLLVVPLAGALWVGVRHIKLLLKVV